MESIKNKKLSQCRNSPHFLIWWVSWYVQNTPFTEQELCFTLNKVPEVKFSTQTEKNHELSNIKLIFQQNFIENSRNVQ